MSDALHIVFRVGTAEYVLPAGDVLQMESFEGATPVPGTAPFVAGVVQVRGRVVPVVDLRARFGLAPTPRTLDSRVLVAQRADRTVALLADSAREVVQIDPSKLVPPPRIIAEQASGFVLAVAQLGTRMLLLIDFDKVIAQESTNGG